MGEERHTLEDLYAIVESEGLDYAIENYVNADKIEDEAVRAKWKAAEEALAAVREMLKVYEDSCEEDAG